MKNQLFTLILSLLFITSAIQAQNVGVGTNAPDPSAKLDIDATNAGILIPRINITSATDGTTITSPATGLMIWNPAISFGTAGFYYNTGTPVSPNWVKISDSSTTVNDADSDPTNEHNTSVTLTGTTLNVIDGGGTESVNLSSLVNDADADPANEYNTGATLSGTTLSITDGGGTQDVNLSSLQDGVIDADADPTNEHNTSVTLTGTTLNVIDGGGTKSQDLGSLKGHDWYEENTTTIPDDINDNIYTEGNVGIGVLSPTLGRLHVQQSADNGMGGITVENSTSTLGVSIWADDKGHIDAGTAGASNLIMNEGGGFVGVGTTAPQTALHVYRNTSMPSFPIGNLTANSVFKVEQSGGSSLYADGNALVSDATSNFSIGTINNADIHIGTDDEIRMTITPTGRVGVNTTSPIALFHIAGDQDATIDSAVIVNSDGRMAIGDNIFEGVVNIATTTSTPSLNTFEATNRAQLVFRDLGGGDRSFITGFDAGLLMGSNWAEFSAAASNNVMPRPDIYLGGTGLLGLGTFTPSTKLHIAATSANITLQDTDATLNDNAHSNGIILKDQNNATTGFWGFGTNVELMSIQNRNDDGEISFYTGGFFERIRIDNVGNVGIGTSSPTAMFHVAGPTRIHGVSAWGPSVANPVLQLNRGAGNVASGADVFFLEQGSLASENNMYFLIDADNNSTTDRFVFATDSELSTATELMTIRQSGFVGMGVANPANPLQMASGARVTAAGVWTNASDARLKTDIQQSKYGLAEVLKLRSVDYNMKKGGEAQVGFLAQEVQTVVPEVVNGFPGDIENGETLGVAYGQLVPVLTKAIQEQQQIIEQLQADLDAKDDAMMELIKKLQAEVDHLQQGKK